MTSKHSRFIVIDDDHVNNMICKMIIAKIIPDADVITFTEPEAGLAYIQSAFSRPGVGKAVLFLDINMPTMTGWEFLEQYEREDVTVQDQLLIYILSSSIDVTDKEKAKVHPHVVDFIEKPLSKEVLLKILG